MAHGHHAGCVHPACDRGGVSVHNAEVRCQRHDYAVFAPDHSGAGGGPAQAGRPALAVRSFTQLVLSGYINPEAGERDGGLVALPVRFQRQFHTKRVAGWRTLAHPEEAGRDGCVFNARRSQRHRPARFGSRHEPSCPAAQRRCRRGAPGAGAAQRG